MNYSRLASQIIRTDHGCSSGRHIGCTYECIISHIHAWAWLRFTYEYNKSSGRRVGCTQECATYDMKAPHLMGSCLLYDWFAWLTHEYTKVRKKKKRMRRVWYGCATFNVSYRVDSRDPRMDAKHLTWMRLDLYGWVTSLVWIVAAPRARRLAMESVFSTTHWYLLHDSFMCVTRLIHVSSSGPALMMENMFSVMYSCGSLWLSDMRSMTHSFVCHDSFICVL